MYSAVTSFISWTKTVYPSFVHFHHAKFLLTNLCEVQKYIFQPRLIAYQICYSCAITHPSELERLVLTSTRPGQRWNYVWLKNIPHTKMLKNLSMSVKTFDKMVIYDFEWLSLLVARLRKFVRFLYQVLKNIAIAYENEWNITQHVPTYSTTKKILILYYIFDAYILPVLYL